MAGAPFKRANETIRQNAATKLVLIVIPASFGLSSSGLSRGSLSPQMKDPPDEPGDDNTLAKIDRRKSTVRRMLSEGYLY